MSYIIDEIINSTRTFGSKKAEDVKNNKQNTSFGGNVNPNNVSYKDPIQDTFGFSQERSAEMFKDLSTMFLIGFCCATCPSLLVFAMGMFLFANQSHNSFKDIMAQNIQQSNDAFSKLNQQVNANQPQNPYDFVLPELPAPQETKLLEAKPEEQPMSPLERAQLRCAKAEDRVQKYGMNLKKSAHAANVANQKVDRAYARMERARLAYETAKEEARAAAEAKYNRASMIYDKRYAEARVANERVDVASAKLDEARVKLDAANQAYAAMQGEETVDVSAVPV